MTGFRLTTFGGRAPKIYPRLLPEAMAQTATNTRLDSGRLEAWAGNESASITPVASYSISASTKTLYKYSDTIWIGSDEDLNIVRSPIAEDPHERIYLTGIGGSSGYPRMATAQNGIGNGTYFRLGLPVPNALTSVTVNNTTTKAESETPTSRAYIYTYVSHFGEESSPMVATTSSIVNVYSDQTVTVSFPTNPTGNYNLTHKRVYRTDSNGNFRLVATVSLSSTNYHDQKTEAQLGEIIPSSNWDAPPDEVSADHPDGPMQGLISLPNGILAGFAGQTVMFSEAFLPHAFPDENKLTVKSDIVAIAPLEIGVLVLTKEKPALISGSDPSSMSVIEIDSTLSCVSKRSVVDMGQSVIYASPDGLVSATGNGLQLITEEILTRDQWQALVPSSMIGFFYEGCYIGFYSTGTENKGFIFDPRGGKNSWVDLDFHATAGFNDLENDLLYLVIGGSVVKFATAATNQNFVWRSKKVYSPRPMNPAIAKVDCDSYSSATSFKLFADGVLKHSQSVTNNSIFRLPSGYKAKEFEVQLEGSLPVNEVCIYESAEEMR